MHVYFLHMQNLISLLSFQYMRLCFLPVLSYFLEKIVLAQLVRDQSDSFGAIFVDSGEEGKTRSVGNDSHPIAMFLVYKH